MKIQSLLSFSLIFLSLTAFADIEQFKVDLSEELPQNNVSETTKVTPVKTANSDAPSVFELGVSSWSPNNLVMDSRVPGTQTFQTAGLPSFSMGYVGSPLISGRAGYLAIRLSASFSDLQRNVPGAPSSMGENLYLLPLAGGIEFHPALLTSRIFGVYLSESIAPTFGFADRSIFDDGGATVGVSSISMVGLQTNLSRLLSIHAYLDLNFILTAGTLGGGDLYGTGLGAGLNFPI